jgi:hypothetical protein
MIVMTPEQSVAVVAELDRVQDLARRAREPASTDITVARLRAVSMASMNAVQVIRDIEAEIRTGATTKEPANV